MDLSTCRDPHTVASLLKQYLRELPEPILTFDMYDSYISAVRDNRKSKTIDFIFLFWKNRTRSRSKLVLYKIAYFNDYFI